MTPDPISSGSARWNLLAAYESQIDQGSTAAQATTYINSLIGNVVSEPASGSKALSAFIAGTGNVLLAYESDALNAFADGPEAPGHRAGAEPTDPEPGGTHVNGLHESGGQGLLRLHLLQGRPTGMAQPALPSDHRLVGGGQQVNLLHAHRPSITSPSSAGGPQVTPKFFGPTGIITKAENAHGFTS